MSKEEFIATGPGAGGAVWQPTVNLRIVKQTFHVVLEQMWTSRDTLYGTVSTEWRPIPWVNPDGTKYVKPKQRHWWGG
jgi:hypothetical protein